MVNLFNLNGNGFYCHCILLTLFNSRMKGEFTKDENELCYANVQEMVQDSKTKPKMCQLKTIMTRPAFKWTVVVILATLAIITVVVPTALEVTKKGICYNLIIHRLLLKSRHIIQTDFCRAVIFFSRIMRPFRFLYTSVCKANTLIHLYICKNFQYLMNRNVLVTLSTLTCTCKFVLSAVCVARGYCSTS